MDWGVSWTFPIPLRFSGPNIIHYSTMMWPFYFKSECQRRNILEIDKYGKTLEQNFSVVEFQICSTDYHTWVCPVFVLEAPLQVVLSGLPKWDPKARTGVYLGHSPFHSGSVALILNTITGNVYPRYHVVFDNTFSTVEHTSKGTAPLNWKNLI